MHWIDWVNVPEVMIGIVFVFISKVVFVANERYVRIVVNVRLSTCQISVTFSDVLKAILCELVRIHFGFEAHTYTQMLSLLYIKLDLNRVTCSQWRLTPVTNVAEFIRWPCVWLNNFTEKASDQLILLVNWIKILFQL